MQGRYREEDLAHRVAEELERERREARQKAGEEMARLILPGGENFSGTSEASEASEASSGPAVPVLADDEPEDPKEETSPPSVDAGARSKPMRRRRTAGEEIFRALLGHDHDNVPPWIDEPPAS